VAISDSKRLTGRCAFASGHRCTRHFQSVALLSDAGTITKMSAALHDQLLAKWQTHDAWPATAETAASISGTDQAHSCSNFCPEVA